MKAGFISAWTAGLCTVENYQIHNSFVIKENDSLHVSTKLGRF